MMYRLTWAEVAAGVGLAVSRGAAAEAVRRALPRAAAHGAVGIYAEPGEWDIRANGASARVRVFEAADGLRFDVLDDVDEGA